MILTLWRSCCVLLSCDPTKSSGGVLDFRAFQAVLNSALAVLRSLDEPMGRPPPRWMITLQSQTHGMRSVARRIRLNALAAFEHGVVTNADRAELQHTRASGWRRSSLAGTCCRGCSP